MRHLLHVLFDGVTNIVNTTSMVITSSVTDNRLSPRLATAEDVLNNDEGVPVISFFSGLLKRALRDPSAL